MQVAVGAVVDTVRWLGPCRFALKVTRRGRDVYVTEKWDTSSRALFPHQVSLASSATTAEIDIRTGPRRDLPRIVAGPRDDRTADAPVADTGEALVLYLTPVTAIPAAHAPDGGPVKVLRRSALVSGSGRSSRGPS